MEKDLNDTQMEIHILVNLNMVKLMVKEYILGKMVKYMMVNGIKEWNKVMVFGKELKMIRILENGRLLKLMATVFILGLTEIGMKVNGKCV